MLWGRERCAVVDSGTNDVVTVYGVAKRIEFLFFSFCGTSPSLSPLMVMANFRQPYGSSKWSLCENLNHSPLLGWRKTAVA